mmetsp:Transcript_26632/g.56724  ORF Transcript_26632/g.56724 Transcript_26632/m.56724 type:complete len:141 (+) Transcript_26632:797-1219(+)
MHLVTTLVKIRMMEQKLSNHIQNIVECFVQGRICGEMFYKVYESTLNDLIEFTSYVESFASCCNNEIRNEYNSIALEFISCFYSFFESCTYFYNQEFPVMMNKEKFNAYHKQFNLMHHKYHCAVVEVTRYLINSEDNMIF